MGFSEFCGHTAFWSLDDVWNTDNPDFSLCFQSTVLSWLPAYQPDCAIADLIAGITVGLTVIPQVDVVTFARVTSTPGELGERQSSAVKV